VNETFGAGIGIRALFDDPTVEGLAAAVDRARGTGATVTVPTAGPRPDRIPLSPAQTRMWFVNRFDPGSGAYNVGAALRLRGELDLDALRAAVVDILERHETLRTIYPDSDVGPYQNILSVDDALRDRPVLVAGTERVAEVDLSERIRALTARGFDITVEP